MKQVWMGAAALLATAAQAGTRPLYQPAPAWVVPAALPAGGAAQLIFDQQQRLAGGTVWRYVDIANRVTSQQSLTDNGTVSLEWQPDDGDLIVHRVAIIRDGQTIDLSGGEPLTVLRREKGLETLALDGVLTATMPVKGLQVGDIVRVSYSVTDSDPALKGAMQSSAGLLPDQTEVGFARVRVLWPAGSGVRWKALAKVGDAKVVRHGGDEELTVATPLPRQPDLPADAPQRFQPLPLVQLTTFREWSDVSRTMAPLFAPVAFPPGSPLAAEAARIRAAASDPLTRAELALESVQGNVRYLFNGLDHGNYVPQPPDNTWTIRSGDCKAKTLLLLSLLNALDITAEPVLANTKLGDTVPVMLPSASAFDHVLVKATVAGRDYWLDGSGLGARLADVGDTPALRHVLPLRPAGASLMVLTPHADARPTIATTIDLDQSAGIGLPAPIRVAITLRGPLAEQIRAVNGQLSAEQRKTLVDKLASNLDQFIGREKVGIQPVERAIDTDAAAGTATIRVVGLVDGRWVWQDQRHQLRLNPVVDSLEFDGDRGRPEWQAIPVAAGSVAGKAQSLTLHLPDHGTGFAVEGDRTLPPTLAGLGTRRTVAEAPGVITVSDRIDETGAEIAPADVAATRAALALAKSRPLKVVAPADYPAYWKVARAARAAGRFAAIEALYATMIRDAVDKPPVIEKRALFRLGVFDRAGAVADLTTVIAVQPTAGRLAGRAFLRHELRDDAGALADGKAAYDLDPANEGLGAYLVGLRGAGRSAEALALLDRLIAEGGERKVALLDTKADILVREHQSAAALAAVEAAIAAKPGNAALLNARCWTKATLGVQLDTALKDCSKALELGASSAATLDSRALVFLKLNRLDDALTDINAALAERPGQSASLFLRGVIETRLGNKAAAADDLAGARFISPRIDEDYRDFGVVAS